MRPSSKVSDVAPCRRDNDRAPILQPSTVRVADAAHDVRVEDLSPAGFAFTSNASIAIGTIVHVGLAGAGRASAKVVWRASQRHGCVFAPALTAAQIENAFTRAGDTAVIALTTSTSVSVASARAPKLKLRRAARVAFLALASVIGWFLLVVMLRGVTRF